MDLGNIITDPKMKRDSDSELSSCITHLTGFKYNQSNESDLEKDLQTIRKWCDKGIQFRYGKLRRLSPFCCSVFIIFRKNLFNTPCRILAGKFKAYNALVNVLTQSLDKERIVTCILETLTSLLTGKCLLTS